MECVKQAQPDLRTRVRHANARQPALVTNILIGINVAVFIYLAASESRTIGGGRGWSQQQYDLGLNRILLGIDSGRWYTLVTSGFIHFGILHLALNMFALYQLGNLLERSLGRVKFGLLYVAGLLGGSAGVILATDAGITGGASGAVFGLLGATAIALHRQGINIMQTGIGMTLLINLGMTFLIPNISIGGHLGGLAAGAICGAVMMAPKWKPVPDWAKYATPVAVSAASVAIALLRAG